MLIYVFSSFKKFFLKKQVLQNSSLLLVLTLVVFVEMHALPLKDLYHKELVLYVIDSVC